MIMVTDMLKKSLKRDPLPGQGTERGQEPQIPLAHNLSAYSSGIWPKRGSFAGRIREEWSILGPESFVLWVWLKQRHGGRSEGV